MSQAGSTGKGGGAGAIMTIAGDTGTISGNNVTIYADRAANKSGSSVGFDNSGTVSTLNVTDINENTIIGNGAGNATVSSDAPSNTGVGKEVLKSLTVGTENCAFGVGSLLFLTEGNTNVAVGFVNLENLVSGDANVALGNTVGQQLLTGSSNIMIGDHAGAEYDGAESSNILIGHEGVTGESNVIRIGTAGSGSGEQNEAFLAGVTGVTVTASAPVGVDTNGQLSSLGFGTATQVLTSNGPGVSPTWQAAGGGGGSATAFFAYLNPQVSNVMGGASPGPYTIICNNTTRNDGTNYSTSTGLFTAPTTGFYCFCATIYLNSTGGFTAGTEVLVSSLGSVSSNVHYQKLTIDATNSLTNTCLPFTWMLNMTAGDTMGIAAYCNNLNQDVNVVGNPLSSSFFRTYTSFSGFLVGT
jgi:hypothetical protein